MTRPNSGAPAAFRPTGGESYAQVTAAAVAALGATDAVVLARIAYRCERAGSWRATFADLAEETGLPLRTAERAVQRLRSAGYVTSGRAGNGMTWRVVWADGEATADLADEETADLADEETANLAGRLRHFGGSGPANVAGTPSIDGLETGKTLTADAAESAARDLVAFHAEAVAAAGGRPAPVTAAQIRAARRLRDEYDDQTIRDVIEWAQAHREFWHSRTLKFANVVRNFDMMRTQRADGLAGPVLSNRHHSPNSEGRAARLAAFEGRRATPQGDA